MTPLFNAVNHRIGPSAHPFEERNVVRRSAPERLRFEVPNSGHAVPQPVAYSPGEARDTSSGRFARFAAILRLWAPA